jgi:two-component system KDP operon response regulator KdpE
MNGNKFFVTIMPCLCFPYAASIPPASTGTLAGVQDVSKRILVVDDDPQIRRILRAVLVAKGYEVIEAECGEDALKLIRSEKYDLMLLDINMPGITGIEVCKEARTSSDIPIVMMSAGEESRAKALDAGANDYLKKPFGVSQIFSCVKFHLGEAGADLLPEDC